jgi:hypothetical protein
MKIGLRHTDPSRVRGLAADLEGLFADQGLAGADFKPLASGPPAWPRSRRNLQ